MSYSKLQRATKDIYTLQEIERALKHRDLMYAYAEAGDLEAIDMLIDAERALQLAKPTDIQMRAVEAVWQKGYKLSEAAKFIHADKEITFQAVKFSLDLIKNKLKAVVDQWAALSRKELADGL